MSNAAACNDRSADKLWLYNLHYFDDLNAEGAPERADWHRVLIERWIAESPPGEGNGWEPYPASLRIVDWVKWALAGNRLEPGWVQSLAVQARWLGGRLERHLLGNHLLTNATALVFAGVFFQDGEAGRWLRRGLGILEREVPEQVLPDGGHFERSPMYHALVLEDLLDLCNLVHAFPGLIPEGTAEGWREAIQRMRGWLAGMVHPDGEIGFFNDAARGVAPRRAALEAYAERLGLPAVPSGGPGLSRFGDSGYLRLEQGPALALVDVAPVGPDHLPGHAHADTLSFELSLFGRRVVVNGGTSHYGVGSERLRERSTVAHSTVEVDGESSSEVWGGFRVARRARPFGLEMGEREGDLVVSCAHDGYRRLAGRPVHRRTWRLGPQGLSVVDRIDGRFREAIARFHLHPEVDAEGEGAEGVLRLADGRPVRWR